MPDVERAEPDVFQQQADATLNQANPTANTLYTVLATTKNVRIYSIVAEDTWTVQPNPLEIVVTIDGQTFNFSVANPVSGTLYVATRKPTLAESAQILVAQADANDLTAPAFLFEGRSVLVQARIGKTVAGTSNPLEARVKYAKIPQGVNVLNANKVIHGMTLGFMGSIAFLFAWRNEYERAYAVLGMMGFYAFGYRNGTRS